MFLSLLYGYYTKGSCATDTPICSQMCVNILKGNGNAVDASVTAALCVGTVSSQASGIGGGGFALIDVNNEMNFVNFREMAPQLAHKNMYINPKDAQRGGLSIATPGELKGLFEMHQKYGQLKWSECVLPVATLATNGFKVTKHLSKILKRVEQLVYDDKGMSEIYTKTINGKIQLVEENDFIYRKNLGTTLELVAKYGADIIYKGALTDGIIDYIKSKNGILSKFDLNHYKVEWGKPIQLKYKNYQVYTTPAPTGGPILGMMLKIAEYYSFTNCSVDIHTIIEIYKHAYAKRSLLGDPNFVPGIPTLTKKILSPSFSAAIKTAIHNITYPPAYYNSTYEFFRDDGTTHISILDRFGNSVSLTSTVNLEFGSVLMDPLTGIIFNDQMDDFSIPNEKNAFDLAPSEANFIAPFKRPQSSAAPAIIKYKHLPALIIGGSGGSRITSAVFKVIVDILDSGIDIDKSIQSSRFHHQLYPNSVEIERDFPFKVELEKKKHILKDINTTFSAVQAIHIKNGLIYASSDKRKHGLADGY